MDPNTVYVLESRLVSMDGATQVPISEFETSTWHNSRVCVWCFQVCKFQSCLLAKYFISVNSCSCTADEEKLRNRSFTVSQILHLSRAEALVGFYAGTPQAYGFSSTSCSCMGFQLLSASLKRLKRHMNCCVSCASTFPWRRNSEFSIVGGREPLKWHNAKGS